jgi:hypothetical protein
MIGFPPRAGAVLQIVNVVTPESVRASPVLRHRIGRHLAWVAARGTTAHWLRHTTLTRVEKLFG